MDAQIQAAIVGAVIGAVLAAGMGLLLDIYREWKKEKRIREILITAMCDDLKHSEGVYNEIIEEWDQQKIIFFHKLIELRESRQTYENNKDWIHIFKDGKLRRDIFTYYLESANCFNALELNQRRKYELENRYNETFSEIKKQHAQLSEEEQKKLVLEFMGSESQEYGQLDSHMSNLMIKLATFKSDAKDLIASLEKEKN